MKANRWMSKRSVEVHDTPDPEILNPGDAIVKISSTAICGSDLHLYNGFVPTMQAGDVLGHEFMGEIVEVGRDVRNLRVGDRECLLGAQPEVRNIAEGRLASKEAGRVFTERSKMPADEIRLLRGRQLYLGFGLHFMMIMLLLRGPRLAYASGCQVSGFPQ